MQVRSFVFVCLLFLLGVVNIAAAQGTRKYLPKVDLGVKLGTNFDRFKGTDWTKTFQNGFHGGAFVGVREHIFGIQGELLVSSGKYLKGSGDIENMYLSVPLLFQVRLADRVWLQLGPQYSFLLSSKYAETDKSTNLFKPGGFSGVIGVQVQMPAHIVLGTRFIYGVSDWNVTTGAAVWTQRSTQLYVGFSFL